MQDRTVVLLTKLRTTVLQLRLRHCDSGENGRGSEEMNPVVSKRTHSTEQLPSQV